MQNPRTDTLTADTIAPVIRRASPVVVWAEAAGIALIAVALGFWARPEDPFFLESGFPWLVFAPALVALRYGFVPGVLSAAILIGAWMGARDQGLVSGEFPKLYFLGTLILVMVCGQFCSVWQTRLRRLEYVYQQLEGRTSRLTRRHYLLRLSHERLEQDQIGRPITLRSALGEVRRLIAEGGQAALPGAPELMRLLVQSCQLEVAALYRTAAGSIEPSAIARVGEPGPLRPDDPRLHASLESGELAHVQTDGQSDVRDAYLVAAPVRNSEGRTLGVLVVEQMPFLALHSENLQTLAVLLGYYADGIERIPAAQVIQELLPSCPLAFSEELVRLHRIWLDVRVPTTLIALQFGAHPERDAYADTLRRSIRDLDMVWEIARDGALTGIVMLPLSGRAALEGYLARVEALLQERFGKNLDAARITVYIAQLEDERPAVTLMALLEHCGVKP